MKRILAYSMMVVGMTGCATPNNPPINVEAAAKEAYIDISDTAHDVRRAAVVVAKDNGAEALAHTYKLEQAIKSSFYHTTDRIAEWIEPEKPKPAQPVASSYCYRSLQDILCYRQPMSGWEHRLVSYQGTHASPPLPAVMKPLPTQKKNTGMDPATRVANAQPVFVAPPPPISEPKKEEAYPMTPDPSLQQLPDPALAPQL